MTGPGGEGATFARPLVAALVGSRLVVLAAAVLAEALPGRNAALTSGGGGPILRSLTSWDGWWYPGIARDGYHVAHVASYHDHAFLPLYQLLYTGGIVASGILESVGRYVTLDFPNSWLLAGRRVRWFRVGRPVVSVALLGVPSVQMFRGYFVP